MNLIQYDQSNIRERITFNSKKIFTHRKFATVIGVTRTHTYSRIEKKYPCSLIYDTEKPVTDSQCIEKKQTKKSHVRFIIGKYVCLLMSSSIGQNIFDADEMK